MRLNKFIAQASGLSRRAADQAIADKRVQLNDQLAELGTQVTEQDQVMLDGQILKFAAKERIVIMLHKPAGYVVSRQGQGSQTIYDLLPPQFQNLQAVGRLDKNSSGLLLLTNDGQLTQELTHPRFQKSKSYEIVLDQPLAPMHQQMISDVGITLSDGPSQLWLEHSDPDDQKHWRVTMHEGRNRQIRRTFSAVGYEVTQLHRIRFGTYNLDSLSSGQYRQLEP